MQKGNRSNVVDHRSLQKERIVAVWRKLQRMHPRTGGPDIFATYKLRKL